MEGQARGWYADVLSDWRVAYPHMKIAKVIADLCGQDSEVAISRNSLADAAQARNATVDKALASLVKHGWLEVVPGANRTLPRTLMLTVSASAALRELPTYEDLKAERWPGHETLEQERFNHP